MSFGLARGSKDLLFCSVDWHSVETNARNLISQEVGGYHPDKLLNTSDDALIAYFVEKFTLEIPVIDHDGIVADQQETQIDVRRDPSRYILDPSRPFYVAGTRIEVEVPFSGDGQFFKVQPTTFSLSPPRGEVKGNKLLLKVEGTNLSGEAVKHQIDRTLAEIEASLNYLRNSASTFNASIAAQAQSQIAGRKEKLLRDRNVVASLGFAMKPRDAASATYATPEVRKKVIPSQPTASLTEFKSEPTLAADQYEEILCIMENMVGVMECSPSAFTHAGEETIRTHFLMQLNGRFEGQASGETFNYEGKTDILIKDRGRNLFIAECKFWRGEAAYAETINQLLGYLSWRDTKAAILVFNRNKNLSSVLDKVSEQTAAHPSHVKLVRQRSETSWVHKLAHRDDPSREMIVTVMVFDVPSPNDESSQG
jgi:hypothetical protein